MLGAIIGDIVGSRFEYWGYKTKVFDLFTEENSFTDDTVMTLAIGKSLLECNGNYLDLDQKVTQNMIELGKKYPYAGYGNMFYNWIMYRHEPYNSFGNGSAMRVSAVPYFAKSLDEVIWMSNTVTAVTHNHPEGIKGAEAVAVAIWMALNKKSKEEIKNYIQSKYYNLDFDFQDLIQNYSFNITCQGSVPQSIFAFLISDSYEDTIRTAISMGGDTDTMAAIAGSIAEAYYGIPDNLIQNAKKYLDNYQLKIINNFLKYKEQCNKNK